MPGPLPKRSEERRRRNKRIGATTAHMEGEVKPAPLPKKVKNAEGQDEALHPAARRWYNALKESGESQFFEPSDWARALIQALKWHRHLMNPAPSAAEYQALIKADADLLTTEAARRRARLEIERANPEDSEQEGPGVTAINDYRKRLASR